MKSHSDDEARVTRYLLGLPPPAEQIRIEEEYFASDQSYEHVLAIEDELTYRWLRHDLPAEERTAYETRYLAQTGSAGKVAFARTLLDVTAGMQREAPRETLPERSAEARPGLLRWLPSLQWISLASATAAAAACLFLIEENRDLRARLASIQNASTAPSRTVVTPAPTLAFLLTPGSTRGSEELRTLRIPPEIGAVRFELRMKDPVAAHLRGFLRTAGGVEVWSQGGLPGRATVTITIPAAALSKDEYIMTLES